MAHRDPLATELLRHDYPSKITCLVGLRPYFNGAEKKRKSTAQPDEGRMKNNSEKVPTNWLKWLTRW